VEGVTFVHHIASPFPIDLPKHEDELIIPAREGWVVSLHFEKHLTENLPFFLTALSGF